MSEFERTPPRRRRRRRRKKINYPFFIFWGCVLLVILTLVAVLVSCSGSDEPDSGDPTPSHGDSVQNTPDSTDGTDLTTEPTTEPTEPPVTLVSTATVSATGDMLMHMPCVRPAKNSDGTYNFEHYFSYLKDYVQQADYAVANLETTLCGLDNGYEYSGYPNFNCPDDIVPSLQNVGFDMLLTANNHCYDTRTKGYHRTQQVLDEYGMDHTGTISSVDQPNYLVVDVNGITLGMICYTYEDNPDPNVVAPNGIAMSKDDKDLINAFNIEDLDSFYTRIEGQIAEMEQAGAEAIVLYIHWGIEYQTTQNQTQSTIAQKMCDLGVDVIVGGHPHVIQPMELLTSTTDESHKTVCLYSTGNALSNQRRDLMNLNTGHTEDGILFTFSFAKYSDGTVRVEQADLLPTWIEKHTSDATGKVVYDVYPLDDEIEDWKTQLKLSDSGLKNAEASYERTMKIVGDGLAQVQAHLSALPPIAEVS